ncbi:hypothetical protein C3L33_02079, partial [Rhododendron williamsianum]
MRDIVMSIFSNLRTPWLVFETHRGQTVTGKPLRRRNLEIKAVVNYVSAEEAKELIAVDGFTVLDVRDVKQFDRAHIKSCHHVPLFIENKDNDLGTIIKRQAHNNFAGLFYGLAFTKLNPDFVESVKSKFSPESKLLLVCQEGLRSVISHLFLSQTKRFDANSNSSKLFRETGNLRKRSPAMLKPFESNIVLFDALRSTSGAQKLEEAGFKNVACVTSGLQSVKSGMFDTVGSTELKDAGKAGLVTIQGKISVVLGTVLICAFLFITFFPDQAEKLLALAPGS